MRWDPRVGDLVFLDQQVRLYDHLDAIHRFSWFTLPQVWDSYRGPVSGNPSVDYGDGWSYVVLLESGSKAGFWEWEFRSCVEKHIASVLTTRSP